MILKRRVLEFARRHHLFDASTRVIAAVSGGSDSMALLHLLQELAADGALRIVAVAHYNHQLRASAERDEAAAAEAARTLGLPFVVGRGDVGARARAERRSIETIAREARYAFFREALSRAGGDVVALGHTRNDQAETFLLRMARGAGPRGFASMSPRRATIVRPLLDVSRAELRAYLAGRGVAYVEDETNADVTIPRNRVRLELLPLLASRFNPGVVDALASEATVARELWAWASEAADELARRVVTTDTDRAVWRLDIDLLRRAPAALRRLVVWRTMSEASAAAPVSFDHVEAALRLVEADAPGRGRFDGPGQVVERIAGGVVLTRSAGRHPSGHGHVRNPEKPARTRAKGAIL